MIKFQKPKNFVAPEGTKEGDYFQVLATVCAEGEDKLSLHEIDGLPLDTKEDGKEKPAPKNMGERIDAGVDSVTGGQPGPIPRGMFANAGGY